MEDDIPTITSLKDLMNELANNWNYPTQDILELEEGTYCLGKLYIEPDRVSYKSDSWYLPSNVYEDFQKLYYLLNHE